MMPLSTNLLSRWIKILETVSFQRKGTNKFPRLNFLAAYVGPKFEVKLEITGGIYWDAQFTLREQRTLFVASRCDNNTHENY